MLQSLPLIARNWAVFLDIDGTLLDYAPTPEGVEVPPPLRQTLARLADALTVSVPELLTACTPSRQNEIDELLGDPFIAEMATFTRQLDAMQRTSVLTQIRDMVAHPRRGA